MLRAALTLVAAAVLTSCGGSKTELRELVRAQLRDPASALFSEEFISRPGTLVVLCGHINARNAMGGRAGKRLFYAWKDTTGPNTDAHIAPSEELAPAEYVRFLGRYLEHCRDAAR